MLTCQGQLRAVCYQLFLGGAEGGAVGGTTYVVVKCAVSTWLGVLMTLVPAVQKPVRMRLHKLCCKYIPSYNPPLRAAAKPGAYNE